MPKRLNIYASGDGSLSFVWDQQGKACGKMVSMYYAEQAIKRKPGVYDDFRLVDMHGPRLIPDVKRIADNILQFSGKAYIQKGGEFYIHIEADNGLHLVKNISAISALKFFLEHEKSKFYIPSK